MKQLLCSWMNITCCWMGQDLSTVLFTFFCFVMGGNSDECHSHEQINGKRKSFVLIMSLKSLSSFWVMWKHSYSDLLRNIIMVYHSAAIFTVCHWNLFLMIYQLTAWLDTPSIWLKALNWKPPALQNDLLPTHSLFSITL